MSLITLPRMLLSDTEGWTDIARIHPTVARMCVSYVMPLSLIPPLAYAFAQQVFPGQVVPLMEPPTTEAELWLVGVALYVVQVVMVALMAGYIRELALSWAVPLTYADAYSLAAIAPTPLWISALALFVPSLWFNVLAVAVAWVGCVLLIRHGIRPLFHVADERQVRRLANGITVAGVGVWIGLVLLLALTLGILMGWR